VTGDFRAFFDLRFVWRLVRARLSAYVVLAAVWAGAALVLQVLKTAPVFLDDHVDGLSSARDRELLGFFRAYYFGCSFVLLLTLLVTRLLAARVYRSAVLKVLRRGRWEPEQLHPRLRDWLGRLALIPAPRPPAAGVLRVVRVGARRAYRRTLFVLLFVVWLLFTFQVYVGEFLNYHPVVGFLNHPTVQLPCFNYIPDALEKAAKRT
jgi:hypothetical protein